MATTTIPPQATLQASPITSIQPGGGLVMSIEAHWGQIRRALLRRLRPGYVSRMAALRQGSCPACPHDIIDSRDLKLYRNVCGYSFRPEDDAFGWRERLGLARPGHAEVVVFSLLCLGASIALGWLAWSFHLLFSIPLGAVLILWIFILAFFRDPERVIPTDPDLLVSPADGTVTHVGESCDPDSPENRFFVVSIFLSVFNVHVNRIPCAGKIETIRYYPGAFLDARDGECRVRNEQLWIDMHLGELPWRLRIKQIAGAVARRIVCRLKEGEEVKRGERLGMIKFGSRTEVLLPVEAVQSACVQVGDQVKGGSTILLRLNRPGPGAENGRSASHFSGE